MSIGEARERVGQEGRQRMASGDGEWYWCLDHHAAETEESDCPPGRRLGPYPSKDAAEHWKERVDQRNQAWDAEEDD